MRAILIFLSLPCLWAYAVENCGVFKTIAFAGLDRSTALSETVRVYKDLWNALGSELSSRQLLQILKAGDPFAIPPSIPLTSNTLPESFHELRTLTKAAELSEKEVNDALLEALSTLVEARGIGATKQMETLLKTHSLQDTFLTRWSPDGQFLVSISPKGVTLRTEMGVKTYPVQDSKDIKALAITDTRSIYLMREHAYSPIDSPDGRKDSLLLLEPFDKEGKLRKQAAAIPLYTYEKPTSGSVKRQLDFTPNYKTLIRRDGNELAYFLSLPLNGDPKIHKFFSSEHFSLFVRQEGIFALTNPIRNKRQSLVFQLVDAEKEEITQRNQGQITTAPLPRIFPTSSRDTVLLFPQNNGTLRVLIDSKRIRDSGSENPLELVEIDIKKRSGSHIPITSDIEKPSLAAPPLPLSSSRALIVYLPPRKDSYEFHVLNVETGTSKNLGVIPSEQMVLAQILEDVPRSELEFETLPQSNQLIVRNKQGTLQTILDLRPFLNALQ